MLTLITYTFRYKTRKNVKLTLQAYNEQNAWLELGDLVYKTRNWELSK